MLINMNIIRVKLQNLTFCNISENHYWPWAMYRSYIP